MLLSDRVCKEKSLKEHSMMQSLIRLTLGVSETASIGPASASR